MRVSSYTGQTIIVDFGCDETADGSENSDNPSDILMKRLSA
jgi:hypothetical protein